MNDLPEKDWNKEWESLYSDSGTDIDIEEWNNKIRDWLVTVGQALGPGYSVSEGKYTILLSNFGDSRTNQINDKIDHTTKCISSNLPVVPNSFETYGKIPIVGISDFVEYRNYVHHYYSEDSYVPSNGVTIERGLEHIALTDCNFQLMESSLVYEYAFLLFKSFSLPLWMIMGFAQYYECIVQGTSCIEPNPEIDSNIEELLKNDSDGFLNGHSFYVDANKAEASRNLGFLIINSLLKKGINMNAFLTKLENEENYSDAFRDAFGMSHEQMVNAYA